MTTFTRRSALALPLALAAAPPALAAQALSPADRALLTKASAYLQGLTEAKAKFVQTDARGQTSSGTLLLKRPGKARFAYDPPSGMVVVSDGTMVSVADSRLKTFEAYPLSRTPLALFLARDVRLDKDVDIQRVSRLRGGFSITARDGRKQTPGTITLNFSDNPVALLGWSAADAQGRITRVKLIGLTRTSGLPASQFVLRDPRPKGVGRGKM
jgi:outer membrane lipoprotein-sorting protein